MSNLDYFCIDIGQAIFSEASCKPDVENIARKALGVLQEDGVYAMFLWLEYKGKNINEKLIDLLNKPEIKKRLLNNSENFPDDNFNKFCEKLKTVAEDIDKLLFLKKILERTLTYALYHAKIGEQK